MTADGGGAKVVVGRACGDCSLCCKVVRVEELAKESGVWCTHCAPGKGGCKIYESRPPSCRDFLCGWLVLESLGPEWFPAKAKLVFHSEAKRVSIWVDPSIPNRWREEPYYSRIRKLAVRLVDHQQVLIFIGRKVVAVLPDREIELGEVDPEDHIMVGELTVPPGQPRAWGAYIERAENIPPEDRNKWIVKGTH